jgi:hypothetical protein
MQTATEPYDSCGPADKYVHVQHDRCPSLGTLLTILPRVTSDAVALGVENMSQRPRMRHVWNINEAVDFSSLQNRR